MSQILTPIEFKETYDELDIIFIGKYANILEYLKFEKRFKHQVELITESKEATIFWNFVIQTDRKIKSNRPYIVVKWFL